jgi:hypothetical protein
MPRTRTRSTLPVPFRQLQTLHLIENYNWHTAFPQHLPQQTFFACVYELRDLGFVTVVKNSNDKRTVTYKLTPRGRARYTESRETYSQWI